MYQDDGCLIIEGDGTPPRYSSVPGHHGHERRGVGGLAGGGGLAAVGRPPVQPPAAPLPHLPGHAPPALAPHPAPRPKDRLRPKFRLGCLIFGALEAHHARPRLLPSRRMLDLLAQQTVKVLGCGINVHEARPFLLDPFSSEGLGEDHSVSR